MIRNSDKDLYVKLVTKVLFITESSGKMKCPIIGEWLHNSFTCRNVSIRNNVYKRHDGIEKYVWFKWKSSNNFCTLLFGKRTYSLLPMLPFLQGMRDICIRDTSGLSLLSHTLHPVKGVTWQMGEFEHTVLPLFFYFYIFFFFWLRELRFWIFLYIKVLQGQSLK